MKKEFSHVTNSLLDVLAKRAVELPLTFAHSEHFAGSAKPREFYANYQEKNFRARKGVA